MEMKKVLSLVLSLCLFVSLGAGISFDVAEAAAVTTVYDFTVASTLANPSKADGEAHLASLTYDSVNALDTNNVSADWAFHSIVRTDGHDGNAYIMSYEVGGPIVNTMSNNKLTSQLNLKIKVPNAGKYLPQFIAGNHSGQPRATLVNVAIHQLNADGTIGTLVAEKWVNSSLYNSGHPINISDVAVDLAAGEYVISTKTEQARANIAVEGFRLVAADTATPATLKLGRGEGYFEVNVDEKIQIPISGTVSDGSALVVATSNGWQFTPDSAAVHTRLNKENGTLDITGLAANTTPETFEYKLGNALVRFNVKVNAADYVAPDKDYRYDFLNNMGSDAKIRGGNALLYSGNPWTTTYASNTTGAYGETRNPNYTSDPWAILSKRTAAGVETPNLYLACRSEQAIGLYNYASGIVDIGILVGTDGYYTPSITFDNAATASANTVSLKSVDGTVTYATKTFAAGTANDVAQALSDAPVALKAGEYKIEINKATANKLDFVESVKLTYAGGLTYNVTLNAGEGTAPAITSYTHGTALTLADATAPEGYTFAGWYDANDNKVTEIAANARGDKAYTAKYNEIPKVYTVTLNANGGTLASNLTEYTGGVGATLPTATKAGYVFAGWYDNADCIGTAVEAIGTDATGDKTFYAKWTLDVAASDFEVTSDSGYYAPYITNPYREGVIAVSAYFKKFATTTIEKAGIMIYVAGNETNEAKIARVETTDVAALTDGKASALFTGIAAANFGKEVIAKAYVVVGGEYVYSDAVLVNVEYAKWLGPKA